MIFAHFIEFISIVILFDMARMSFSLPKKHGAAAFSTAVIIVLEASTLMWGLQAYRAAQVCIN